MSFGGGPKNPPWQRNTLGQAGQQGIPSLQAQMGLPNPGMVGFQPNQSVFNQNIAMAQQQQQQQQQSNLSIISQMSGNLTSQLPPNQIFTQAVSYPAPRALNAIAFPQAGGNQSSHHHQQQQQQQQQQPPVNQSQSNLNKNQRVFNGTGIVTKMQNDIGFVDEEVIFHKNVCNKGILPKVGDRVFVEASYNQNMPYKWNATRIQVASGGGIASGSSNGNSSNINPSRSTGGPIHKSSSGYNAVPPPSENGNFSRNQNRSRNVSPPPRRSLERHSVRSRDSRHRDSDAVNEDTDRKRRRDDRDKDRYRDKRDHSIERKERSPIRRTSPKKRRTRVVPRYMVQIPKVSLTMTDGDVLELRRRYTNLYVPSDFFSTQIRWAEAFPPNAPFSIQKPCSFHIMHKDMEIIPENDAILEPADADYLFSAKVMLMGMPPMSEVYHKCFATAEEKDKDDERDFVHPTRLINFLVGIRGKNETMAIGGPWSPSLDGENPQTDISVLIKTAIRNCKALTGIDLSRCTQWYRFVELYYRRSETIQKGRVIPARIETVVIFLPDVRTCIPTRLEWDALHLSYKNALERCLNQNSSSPSSTTSSTLTAATTTTKSTAAATSPSTLFGQQENGSSTNNKLTPICNNSNSHVGDDGSDNLITSSVVVDGAAAIDPVSGLSSDVSVTIPLSSTSDDNILSSADSSSATVVATAATVPVSVAASSDGNTMASLAIDKDDGEQQAEVKREPVHYTELDPKTMKIQELRDELNARNLSSKGVKPQLIARLTKALKNEAIEANKEEELNAANTSLMTSVSIDDEDNDGMEIEPDLTDLIIIDEVGSSTIPTTITTGPSGQGTNKSIKSSDEVPNSKKEEVKILDEKERQLLEKRYTLPETPQLIIHPSKIAKSGKFDCTIMSLSLLLDYRPEDTKEHSFEVSLFAELFNEMLMRDFGFNIYKALYLLPDKIKEQDDKKKSDDKKSDDNNKNKNANNDKGTDNDKQKLGKDDQLNDDKSTIELFDKQIEDEMDKKSPQNETADKEYKKDKRDREKDRESKNDKSSSRSKHHEDDSDDDNYSIKSGDRKKKEKDRQKYYTADPDLLLSFVYFDQTHCGYIFEKDIEDLFYTLGLSLSRAQTRKLVGKVISRDSLYYRKLTDKAREEKEEIIETKEHDADEKNMTKSIDINEIAKGNKFYLPVFKTQSAKIDDHPPPAKRLRTENENEEVTESTNGIVMFNGGLLDIGKLLEQMKRSEQAREDTEKILVELRKQNTDLSSANSKASNKIKDLSSDIRSSHRKLNDTEQSLSSSQKKLSEYHSILSGIYDKISPIFIKSEKSSSSSSSSSRIESSREQKDKDKDSKDQSKSDVKKESDDK